MEKDLKNKLVELQNDFDAHVINEYFANDFADDYEKYKKNKDNIKTLEFLNDEFIDIDTDFSHTDEFEEKIKEVMAKALEMLS